MGEKRLHFLCVGHCHLDGPQLARVLQDEFAGQVAMAATADEAINAVRNGAFDLLLINRVLDADQSLGLDLIKRLQADARTRETPVMLVSNYPEAQKQAESLGALPGFGKQVLGQQEMCDCICGALNKAAVLVSPPQRVDFPNKQAFKDDATEHER